MNMKRIRRPAISVTSGAFLLLAASVWGQITASQAQQSSSKLEKIASCGPNSLYRRFAETPEVLPSDGGIHIRTPRVDIDQEAEDKILVGDIYILKFEQWSINQAFPGGQTEALAFFRHHCFMAGRGDHPVVIEKRK